MNPPVEPTIASSRTASAPAHPASPLWPLAIIPLLALAAVLPLIFGGYSCGHDFDFHLQSWIDAGAQIRHGTLHPAWTFSAAWNAGEPRFTFYPPLSWTLGALLTLALPISATPVVFTWLAFLGAGIAMYRLAAAYTTPHAALLATAVYLANPYMLFTAFERTAYGELLAAAWLPLLLLAALRRKPAILLGSFSLALLWITNAPAAVIGVYLLLGIALVRSAILLRPHASTSSAASHSPLLSLLARFAAMGTLGLALPAFYLLPAAIQRRYVQVEMAIIPNMRFEDNFLFGHTGDAPHDHVLHTASALALSLLVAAAIVTAVAWFTQPRTRDLPANPQGKKSSPRTLTLVLAAITLAVAFLLTPISTPFWRFLPELAFLQFPWRLLSVEAVVLSLAIALALHRLPIPGRSPLVACTLAIVLSAAASAWAITQFRQPCELSDAPRQRAALFHTGHGVPPTDEYTPADADNDVLRWGNPSFWLSSTPSGFAPGTIPNPAATIVNYDVPPPVTQTIAGIAPRHLVLHLTRPEILILNLRDFPSWRVTRNGVLIPNHLRRDDGLLAVDLPAGDSTVDVRWHRTWDQLLGDAITLLALLLWAALLRRSRTIRIWTA